MSNERRVWVGCLACYNAGRLVGDWMSPAEALEWECPTNGPTIDQPINDEWTYEVHEETWVMDHDGFAGFLDGKCSPAHAAHVDATLTELEAEGLDLAAVQAYCANEGVSDLAELELGEFQAAYCGEWDSERVYAEELAEELHGISARAAHDDVAARYFDYEAFARGLFVGDYYSVPTGNGTVYVFRSI